MITVINITEEGRYGGPQARIAAVAGELKKLDVETIVVCPEHESEHFQRSLVDREINYRSERLFPPSTSLGRSIRYLITFLPQLVRLSLTLRELDADLVHCNGSWQFKSVLAAKLAGKKVVWHLNDTKILLPLGPVWLLTRRMADGYIFASEKTKSVYFGSGPTDKPSAVVQAPVDTEEFNPDAVENNDPAASESELMIVTVANLNPTKDLEVLVEAAAAVSEELGPGKVSFVVAGAIQTTQRAYLKRLESLVDSLNLDNVHFVGLVEEVAAFLSTADIYVCSSRREASPMAVWEAMAMALPVVSTDVGDVRRMVEGNGCGYVVPVGDAEGLAERMLTLARDSGLRSEMGQRGRQVAREKLDVRICAQDHLECYERIVSVGG